jgi:hypothetical protein
MPAASGSVLVGGWVIHSAPKASVPTAASARASGARDCSAWMAANLALSVEGVAPPQRYGPLAVPRPSWPATIAISRR